MSLPYALRTLGPPALVGPDGTPVRIRTRKHLALLAYLAIEPRHPVRRDFLTELLWPRSPMAEARHSLATALSILRGMLGRDAFEAGRDMVRLASPRLVVDLERLEAGDVLGDELTPPLELGDLLQDLEIPDAPGFMHWLDRQRARWRPAVQAALLQLMDRARRSGDMRRLDALADRLFALEELSEQGMRAKMEAAALSGDRVGALKRFDQWVGRLHKELNAVPSPFMRRFADLLRRGGIERGPAAPMLGGSAAAAAEPFVGRGVEYRALYEAWERTLERTPRHVVVLGESGVGKTTLVARFLGAAALEGAVIARVRCYEVERDIPYAAVGTLLRQLAEQPGAAGARPEALADLAVAVPAMRERFPGLPAPIEVQGEGARVRFTEAALELLLAVAEEAPVLLTVDDLHLADDASVAVLHLLLRRLGDERVSLVVTSGPSALDRNAAGRLLEAGPTLGLARLAVRPLAEAESVQLLEALLGTVAPAVERPGPAVRRALVRAGRGYPLALVLLVRDWEAHSEEAVVLSLEAMTEAPRGEAEPADAYALLLDRVVARLGAPARAVLEYAAVLGSRMNELDWYGALALEPGRVMMALSTLAHQRVLRDGGSGLEFTNELLRAHFYVRIPAVIRRELHSLATERLLARDAAPGAVSGLELAWHLIRCGRAAEATGYLLRGAREAIERGAPDEAERALVTGATSLNGDAKWKGQLLLAEAIQEQGRYSDSASVVADVTGVEDQEGQQIGHALLLTALVRSRSRDITEVRATRVELTTLLTSARSSRARAIAAAGAASSLEQLQESDGVHDAEALLASLSERSIGNCAETDQAQLRVARALALYALRRTAEAQQQLSIAEGLLAAHGIVNATLCNLYHGIGALACATGAYAEALGALKKAAEIANKLGNDYKRHNVLANLALCAYRTGDISKQILWSEEALFLRPKDAIPGITLTLLFLRAMGCAVQARPQASYDAINAGDRLCQQLSSDWLRQSWLLGKADLLCVLGRDREAITAAEEACQVEGNGVLALSRAGPVARWAVRIAVKRRQLDALPKQVSFLLPQIDRLDAIDRADLLAAVQYWHRAAGIEEGRYAHALADALEQLPDGVRTGLGRLGLLERPRLRDATKSKRHGR